MKAFLCLLAIYMIIRLGMNDLQLGAFAFVACLLGILWWRA